MQKEILAIVGPTASGKTELGLRLAREQNGEIISVDSRQVYRFLSVGTAKPAGTWEPSPALRAPSPIAPSPIGRGPTAEVERSIGVGLLPMGEGGRRPDEGSYLVQGIPYHLVDSWDPNDRFSAATFVKEATTRLADIRSRGKTPIFVGGTGLYYKALVDGLAPMPPADENLRTELRALAEKRGRPFLHQELFRIDPAAAARIPANNIQRVMRALEVYRLTGKPISQWHAEHPKTNSSSDLRLTYIGLNPGKKELHRRIEERSRKMIAEGMIQETRDLLNRGYAENCPALTGLGYRRVIDFLKGSLSKEDLLKFLVLDTRQYAKRQMTWFTHQLEIEWKK